MTVLKKESIPEYLIYEMDEGRPIYYRGYKDVLNGSKHREAVMGSSFIQSLLITKLVVLLSDKVDESYYVLTNELGVQFAKKSWRAADIALVKKDSISPNQEDNQYLHSPPKIVIEIDTKAELEELHEPYSYFHRKTEQFLDFGVEKVIWVFTNTQKVMIAEKDEDWKIINWNKDINVLEGISINISKIIPQ